MKPNTQISASLLKVQYNLESFGQALMLPLEPEDPEMAELIIGKQIKEFQSTLNSLLSTLREYLVSSKDMELQDPEAYLKALRNVQIISESEATFSEMLHNRNKLVAVCLADYKASVYPALLRYCKVMRELCNELDSSCSRQ